MTDIVDDLLRLISGVEKIYKPGSTKAKMADRRVCEQEGHRYRVYGKKNPTKVACSRCEVTWAIGPRTEPS